MPLDILGLDSPAPAMPTVSRETVRRQEDNLASSRPEKPTARNQAVRGWATHFNSKQITPALRLFTLRPLQFVAGDVVDYFLRGKPIGYELSTSGKNITGYFEPQTERRHPDTSSPLNWDYAVFVDEGFNCRKLQEQLVCVHRTFAATLYSYLNGVKYNADDVSRFIDGELQRKTWRVLIGDTLQDDSESSPFRTERRRQTTITASSYFKDESLLADVECNPLLFDEDDPSELWVWWQGRSRIELRLPYEATPPPGTTLLDYFLAKQQVRFELPDALVDELPLAGWIVPAEQRPHPCREIPLDWHYAFYPDKQFRENDNREALREARMAFDAAIYLKLVCEPKGLDYSSLPTEFIEVFQPQPRRRGGK